ncbi:MAG: outer membrane beta-barrel protein [Deltaproteobacteria bacterium]
MKRTIPVLVVLVIAILVAASPAAGAATQPNYAAFKAGVYSPGSSDLGGESGITNADTGFNLEAAFGRYVAQPSPHFALAIEGGIGVFAFEAEYGIADEIFVAVPVTLSAKLAFPSGPIEPYFVIGAGVYFVGHESDDPFFGTEDDDDTAAGVHLGAGVNFDVSRLVYIGGELKYRWLEVTTFGLDSKLDGLTGTANVGFRF